MYIPPTSLLLQPLLNLLQVLGTIHLDDAIDLAGIPHQLLGAGVQHLDFAVACDGEVVEHDIGDGEAAGILIHLVQIRSDGSPNSRDRRRSKTDDGQARQQSKTNAPVSTDNSTARTAEHDPAARPLCSEHRNKPHHPQGGFPASFYRFRLFMIGFAPSAWERRNNTAFMTMSVLTQSQVARLRGQVGAGYGNRREERRGRAYR